MLKVISKVALLVLTIPIFGQTILAQNQNLNLPSTVINPDSFYYSFKRGWEKIREKLAFSNQAKIDYAQTLIKTRLAELKFVVDNKILSEVQRSSERFAYQTGILTEEAIRQNRYKKELTLEFEQFSKFLEGLRDKYPANTSFWMLIQHDINTLNILSERLRSF